MRLNIKKFIISVLAFAITLSCLSGAFGIFGVFGSSTYVVSNGESEYKIVIAKDPDSVERTAAYELQKFFSEATGVILPIINDEGINAGGKYFSIGKTSLVTNAVENELTGLKSNGYLVKTVDQTVYLIGPSAYGSLYATYGFLNDAFDYEFFFTDVYTLKTDVKNLELKDYSIKVNPDINGLTDPNAGIITYNLSNKNRYNVEPTNHYFIPANGTTETHNLWYIMPQAWSSDAKYSKWFSDNAKTACFSAHGDQEAFDKMTSHFAQVAIDGMMLSDATIFTVAQPDNAGFCSCVNCNSADGGPSAVVIEFCNEVARKVDNWLDSAEGQPYNRDFKLLFLAYQSLAKAPTNNVKCADNVGIYLAFDYSHTSYSVKQDDRNSPTYSGVNNDIYDTIMAWKEVTNTFFFWTYNINYEMYFFPYDTTDYNVDFYKIMKEVGTIGFNSDAQYKNKYTSTAWGNVKAYLTTKLRWNVNLNVNDTIRKYFDVCYKDAADIMYDIYCQYKAHWAMLRYRTANGTISGDKTNLQSLFGNLRNQAFWGREMLESWVSQFKQAIKAIEPLKATDPKAYESAYKMIAAEITSPMAMLIELYSTSYSTAEFKALGKEFIQYCTDAEVIWYASGTCPIEEFYESRNLL